MRTGQTQGSSKPNLARTIFWVLWCVMFLVHSIYTVYTTHHYRTIEFLCDLAFLFIIGYEITSYRTALYRWKVRKAWEDQLRKDSE